MPNDGWVPGSYVTFALRRTDVDRASNDVIIPPPVVAVIGENRQISVPLWRNSQGEMQRPIDVVVHVPRVAGSPHYGWDDYDIGPIVVPNVANVDIATLLPFKVSGASEYDVFKGDSQSFAVVWLDRNGVPANMAGFGLSASLVRNGTSYPIGAAWITAAQGKLEANLSASISASMPIGEYQLVIRAASSGRVTSLRATVNII